MTRNSEVDRVLEAWLTDGPSQLPDRAIDSILTQLDDTKQRKSFWLPGGIRMNRMILGVGGIAAAIVLAAVGVGYFLGPSSGFGNQPTPSPSPTPIDITSRGAGELQPGRYSFDAPDYRYTFSVTGDGWVSDSEPQLFMNGDPEQSLDFAALWIWDPIGPSEYVYADPCQWGTSRRVIPGPTVDDFATALTTLDIWEASEPTDTNVGGFEGKRIQLTVPADANFADCTNDEFHLGPGRWMQGPGQVEDMRILDFDGARHLLFTTYLPGAPPELRAELEQMVESMQIEPIAD